MCSAAISTSLPFRQTYAVPWPGEASLSPPCLFPPFTLTDGYEWHRVQCTGVPRTPRGGHSLCSLGVRLPLPWRFLSTKLCVVPSPCVLRFFGRFMWWIAFMPRYEASLRRRIRRHVIFFNRPPHRSRYGIALSGALGGLLGTLLGTAGTSNVYQVTATDSNFR